MTGPDRNGPGQRRFVDLARGRFHYLEWGSEHRTGPGVVLLHGNADSAATWWRVGPVLAQDYRVVAPDLRGHGHSGCEPGGDLGLQAAADDVAALLTGLGLGQAIVAGHSWGAAIALVLATGGSTPARASRLSALVLEDLPPAMAMAGREREVRDVARAAGLPAEQLQALVAAAHPQRHDLDNRSQVEGLLRADAPTVLRVIRDGARSGPLLPLLARLTTPTLLLRADPRRGGVLSEADWELACALVPALCTVVELPGAAHDIHRSDFDEFMHALGRFLRRELAATAHTPQSCHIPSGRPAARIPTTTVWKTT